MKKTIVLAILVLMILPGGLAIGNNTNEDAAIACISQAKYNLDYLIKENFTIQRAKASLNLAEKSYLAQLALKQKNQETEFSLVLPYCQEVNNIKELAIKAQDNFMALEMFYQKKEIPKANFSIVDSLIQEISKEIADERYEQALGLINQAYGEIITIGSSSTSLNLFYKTTTRNIKTFIMDNWITLVVLIALAILFTIFYRKKIAKYIIKRKIKHFETEKRILKQMTSEIQKSYFQEGKISEGAYNIRVKKFAELIRDIDRQIPLLQEELEKIVHERVKKIRR